MTRPIPDRRRLGALAGAFVLAVPLVLASAAIPDALPARAATPAASPAESIPPSEPVGDVTEADAPSAPADTLDRYIATRTVEVHNGDVSLDLGLASGASRAVAEAVADEYSAGGEPGTLRVTYDGGVVQRSTVRRAALPPPPPPPPPAPPAPPSAPEPPVRQLGDMVRMMDAVRDTIETERTADQLRQQLSALRALAESQRQSTEDLERVARVLEGELVAVEEEISDMTDPNRGLVAGSRGGAYTWRSLEDETRYIRLETRRDLVRSRYRQAIERLERRRLDDIVDGAQGDG